MAKAQEKMTIAFSVVGKPVGQPRPRAFARKTVGQWRAKVYDAGTAEHWKSQIAVAAQTFIPASPLGGPLKLSMDFHFVRPKSHFGTGRNKGTLRPQSPLKHTQKPDTDNLAKAVMDAMSTLRFWNDDAQVCDVSIRKHWSELTQGMYLVLEPFDSD